MSQSPTVVFDLDGTLVHSLPGLALSLNRTLAELGREQVQESAVGLMIGEGAYKLVERALTATGGTLGIDVDAMLTRFLDYYDADALTHTTLFPAAREVLDTLAGRGVKLGLCTNKPQDPTLAIIDLLGLAETFSSIVGGDTLDVRKPHPRHVLETVTRAGGDPSRAVFVGDSPTDANAAHAADLPLVLLRHGYSRVPLEDLGADAVLNGLAPLVALLDDRGWL